MYLVLYITLNQNSVIFTQLKSHTTKQKPLNSAIFTATKVTTPRTQIKPHTTKPNNPIHPQNSNGRVIVSGATPTTPARYCLCS